MKQYDTQLADLQKMRQVYADYFWEGTPEKAENIDELWNLLEEDSAGGLFFRDINYADDTRTGWIPIQHCIRLHTMLRHYGREALQTDAAFRRTVERLMLHWVNHDYKSDNWWWNDIGGPLNWGKVAIMCYDSLPETLCTAMAAVIRKGCFWEIPRLSASRYDLCSKDKLPPLDGANFIWGVAISMQYALVAEDLETLNVSHYELDRVLTDPRGEGVNPDHSFHQHGTRWYSGGYGRSFLINITPMLYVFYGGGYTFDPVGIDKFIGQLLEGARWFTHRGYYDYHAVGRELTRLGGLYIGLVPTVKLLLRIPQLPRLEQLQVFLQEIQNLPGTTDDLQKTVFYPYISHLSHKYDGIYFGITCLNKGQQGAESCNREGVLCYNMSYGSRTCFMGTGKEYFDIDPIFDYACVPGTTTFYETEEELLTRDNHWGWIPPNPHNLCDRECAFSLVKGNTAVLSQQVIHDEISWDVTYFVCNGTLMVLGTNLKNGSGKELYTTIDQCFAVDVVQEAENCASCGCLTYHKLPDGNGVSFRVEHRHGTTQKNNLTAVPQPREGDVFMATIPNVKEGYAYAVTKRGKALDGTILQNTPQLQAVAFEDGTVCVAFHQAGTFTHQGKTIQGSAKTAYIL